MDKKSSPHNLWNWNFCAFLMKPISHVSSNSLSFSVLEAASTFWSTGWQKTGGFSRSYVGCTRVFFRVKGFSMGFDDAVYPLFSQHGVLRPVGSHFFGVKCKSLCLFWVSFSFGNLDLLLYLKEKNSKVLVARVTFLTTLTRSSDFESNSNFSEHFCLVILRWCFHVMFWRPEFFKHRSFVRLFFGSKF